MLYYKKGDNTELVKEKQNNKNISRDQKILMELKSAQKTFSALKVFNAGLVGFNAYGLERVLTTGEGSVAVGVATLILSATAFVTALVWEKQAKENCKRISQNIAIQDELSKD